jgi:3-phenylpropionate/trans-cinnamate dioxygenase alpha subunit
MTISNEELVKLVDWENGLISPEIFISEEIYQMELERLFGRTWLFLAHDSMFPNPGDFFSTYMGGDPVIIARQKDGSVKAFLNVCRHRGMKVCRAEEGNANAFMCTYHGWTYDGSGALVSVPNFEDAYYGELEMAKWGLVPVRVESYKGLWFGNFDESAPSLIDYLGEMVWYLDGWLDRTAGGIEVVPGTIKWTITGNWKIAAEQFAGDAYHAPVSHSSSLGRMIPNYAQLIAQEGRQVVTREGHGQGFVLRQVAQARFENETLQRYRDDRLVEAAERLGEQRPLGGHFTIFPTFSGLGGNANIRVWHPKGPNKFEIWSWTVVDKEAPVELKKAQARGSLLTEGASGTVEQDDGENWNLMGQLLQEGYQARRHAWNYQMGLGHEHDNDELYPGRIGGHRFGDTPQRGMYRRWLEFMTTDSWPRVENDPRTAQILAEAKARG